MKGFLLQLVKSIIRDTLRGVQYLHLTTGLIFADLKPDNVLLRLCPKSCAELSAAVRLLNDPKHSFFCDFAIDVDKSILHGSYSVSDMGCALQIEAEDKSDCTQTRYYRAPKILLGFRIVQLFIYLALVA